MNVKVLNYFNFNCLVIDHDVDDNIVFYVISKDRYDYVKLIIIMKNDHFLDVLVVVKKDM